MLFFLNRRVSVMWLNPGSTPDSPDAGRRYEQAVSSLMQNIGATATGRAFFGALASLPRAGSIEIVPQQRPAECQGIEPRACGCRTRINVHARPAIVNRDAVRAITPRGLEARTDLGEPVPGLTGTGLGVWPARVHFTPYFHCHAGPNAARLALTHELVHAAEQVTGQAYTSTVPSWLNREEWEACLISNMLAGELGLPLRDGYDVYDPVFDQLLSALGLTTPAANASPSSGSTPESGSRIPPERTGPPIRPMREEGYATRQLEGVSVPGDVMRSFSAAFRSAHLAEIQAFAQAHSAYVPLQSLSVPFNPLRP